ncbi:hypothetical protein ACHAXM_004002 [Skeletonema potamos]
MNLKLSTSAAALLAINSIVKTGGAGSKAVLADKVAASYERHFDVNDGDRRKLIVQHARDLQARLKKATGNSDVNLAAQASAPNAKSDVIGSNAIGRQLPDVGILGMRSARGRSMFNDYSNVHSKKDLIGNMVKSAAPDVGILGGGKGELRRTHKGRGNGVIHNRIISGGHPRQLAEAYSEGNATSPTSLYGGDGALRTQYLNCMDTSGNTTLNSDKTVYDCACDYGFPYLCVVYAGYGPACDIQKCCQEQTDSDGKMECIVSAYENLTAPLNVGSYLCESAGTGNSSSVATRGLRQLANNSSGTEVEVPTCQCKEEKFSTCGPDLCNCLESSQGNVSSCLDEMSMLCEEPTTMDQCIDDKILSSIYCVYLPCYLDGGFPGQCTCDMFDHICSTSGDPLYENFTCPISTCCRNQSDDEGMLSCFDGTYLGSPYAGPGYGYGSNYTVNAPYEEYTDCKATNSTPWCACNILAPSFCAEFENYFCDIQTCCQSQTDDAGRVDCVRNVIYDECISSGSNSTFCLCESSSISCLLEEDQEACEVNECCFSVDDYDGMKDCLDLGMTPSDSSSSNATITIAEALKSTTDSLIDTQSSSSTECNSVIKSLGLSLIMSVVGLFIV